MSVMNSNNVITTISENDEMYLDNNTDHYFGVGRSALSIIEDTLHSQEREKSKINTILDMPCGHGRVTRHLRSMFPKAEITGCDINQDGVDFCEKTFNTKSVYSNNDFAKVRFNSQFDLIWVGSLITHFDIDQTKTFLNFITSYLSQEGFCLCSSHGAFVAGRLVNVNYGLPENGRDKVLKDYFRTGYGYADFEGQKGYGTSLISQNWFNDFFKDSNFQIIKWYEQKWDNHHDVIGIAHRRSKLSLSNSETKT